MDVEKKRQLATCKGHLVSCFVWLPSAPVFCSLRYREQLVIETERPRKPVLRKIKAIVKQRQVRSSLGNAKFINLLCTLCG